MFIPKTPTEKTGLEEARDAALADLKNFTADDDGYKEIIAHVDTLTKLIDLEKAETVSADTKAKILGNVVIVLMFLGYESKHVFTSKATTFLTIFK